MSVVLLSIFAFVCNAEGELYKGLPQQKLPASPFISYVHKDELYTIIQKIYNDIRGSRPENITILRNGGIHYEIELSEGTNLWYSLRRDKMKAYFAGLIHATHVEQDIEYSSKSNKGIHEYSAFVKASNWQSIGMC